MDRYVDMDRYGPELLLLLFSVHLLSLRNKVLDGAEESKHLCNSSAKLVVWFEWLDNRYTGSRTQAH